MTKSVRIENADTSDHKVVVEVWEKSYLDGMITDRLVETHPLDYPTAMVTKTIWKDRYLVIREA